MEFQEIMQQLQSMGSESVKKIFINHGINEPLFGVKVGDLKTIQKKIKKDQNLAFKLFETGNYDAMYLAGLIADESKMTKNDIQNWVQKSNNLATCQYTVAWVAAESAFGWQLGLEWINSPNENIAVAGWNSLSGVISMKADADLDLEKIKILLQRVENEIHTTRNMIRYAMNNFIITVGGYVLPLHETAKSIANNIGQVIVSMGNTACKVPLAAEYIAKMEKRGAIGKKKKTIKC